MSEETRAEQQDPRIDRPDETVEPVAAAEPTDNAEVAETPVDETAGETPTQPTCRCCRRAFVGALGAVAGLGYVGALSYPVYRYLNSAAEDAAKEAAVKEVTLDASAMTANSAQAFKFGGRPALLIKHADGTYTALSAVCTHLGCTVSYEADQSRIHCACHGGVYDPNTGANVSGPPPKPLTLYKTAEADGKVVVTRE